MYTAVSAIGVRFGINKKWEEISLDSWMVKQLIDTFRRGQITLTIPSSEEFLYLDMDILRSTYPLFVGTLQDLLIALGNTALPTTSVPLVLNQRTALWKDCFKAGYTMTPVTHSNNDNPSILLEDKPDLRLTRENPATDYLNFYKTCLVSINGLYHQTDTDGINGIVVTDAMKSLRQSQQNQIGLYNFGNMGNLEFVPITDAMIQQPDLGEARITIPQDLTGKTVFLVLGGYFTVVDPLHFSRVGDSTYLLDFNNLPMRQRYYESRQYLDLSALPVDTTPQNDDQILAANLTSDEFIRAYLKMSQTFFVILDTTEVFVQRLHIKRSNMPDQYTVFQKPFYPLVTGLGRHPEYWQSYEDRQWSLQVYDNLVARRIFETINERLLTGIDDGNEPPTRAEISASYLLEIGRDV